MASDYLLEIEGIKGESSDAKHKGEIDIQSYSWGLSNSGQPTPGGTAKPTFQDFGFTSGVSRASPPLFLACATGQHFKSATLTVRKAGEKPLEYLKIKLSDCIVSSYQQGGSPDAELPVDQFSLNYAKIEFEYRVQKPDGSTGPAVKASYDRVRSSPTLTESPE